ncbi:hypothetical protein GBA52_016208 [Prunus armeniaca]|nr:hypothetical protein GBA52_016208 [Prunus armeniaca]
MLPGYQYSAFGDEEILGVRSDHQINNSYQEDQYNTRQKSQEEDWKILRFSHRGLHTSIPSLSKERCYQTTEKLP